MHTTIVSFGTISWSAGALVTIDRLLTTLIKHTVVIALLQGVPLAVDVVIAGLDTVLKVRDFVRVHEDTLALDRFVAVTGWTPVLVMIRHNFTAWVA